MRTIGSAIIGIQNSEDFSPQTSGCCPVFFFRFFYILPYTKYIFLNFLSTFSYYIITTNPTRDFLQRKTIMKPTHCNRRYNIFYGTLFLIFILINPLSAGEAVEGTWRGSISIPGNALDVIVTISAEGEKGLSGRIDIPVQGATGLQLIDIVYNHPEISFTIEGIPGSPTFIGKLSDDGDTITGDFSQSGQTFSFSLEIDDEAEQKQRAERQAQKLESITAFIDTARSALNVPGLAIAIVKDDEVIYIRGFGYRNIEENLPVTQNTLFAIGSSTKAFTAMGVGILVDEGKIDLDKPVREYLPDFRLYDRFATENMTPRDLITHRSGLPRHDLMWYGSDFTRREMYHRLRYLEPSKDLRANWQYQNLMYMTAGYLIEKLSGATWEDFTRERIFNPLGMKKSNFSVSTSQQAADHALPYRLDENRSIEIMEFRDISEIGPAGSINSNVEEMAQWLRLNLSGGKINDAEILSSGVIRDMQTPHMVLSSISQYNEIINQTYGLGWFIEAYRGYRYIHHGGNIDGFSALVTLVPTENLGVVVLTNLNGNSLPAVVTRYVVDIMLEMDPVDWYARLKPKTDDDEAKEKEEEKEERVEGTSPSHPLKAYAGDYKHPGYGTMKIENNGDSLIAMYNGFDFDLEHWHYNVFRGAVREMPGMKFMLSFSTNVQGDIDKVSVPLEASIDAIEFKRIPDSRLYDTTYLSQFTGEYDLSGQIFTIALRGRDRLTIAVAGQQTRVLEPYKEHEFTVADLSGYGVRFVVDENGAVIEMQLIQPNGVFTAKRKE
jgi:CubicO group peptidase (beta-lactamase class C family)